MESQSLITAARIYAAARGIAMATLGTYLVRDAKFFDRLSVGRVTVRRVDRAARRLSEMWPDDLAWPSDIPRPESPKGTA